jgi:hypothetical protein
MTPVEQIKVDIEVVLAKRRANDYAKVLTQFVVDRADSHGPGETVLALTFALARIAAAAKPEETDDDEWLASFTEVLWGEYQVMREKMRERRDK